MRFVRTGVVSVVILAGGACSSSGSNPSSTTPRITSSKVGAASKAKLLTARDVQRVAGFTGARAQELASVPLFENPDPRGPCGGHVSGLSTKGGYGRAFATTQRQLVQINMPSTAALRGYSASKWVPLSVII